MDVTEFIQYYREAFGEQSELPIAFWYADSAEKEADVIKACFFKCFHKVRSGQVLSLSRSSITCGGGLFYTGFTDMPERIPRFVSVSEKYKQTPESVLQFIDQLPVRRTERKFLNFARIDRIDDLSIAEGFLFFATPDQLSGLMAWTWFDNHDREAVVTSFGSGCSQTITQTINENKKNGRRTFLGGFDPSVRAYLKRNELTYCIPASRMKEMLATLPDSCLYGTKAWGKVYKRIQQSAKN